MFKKIGIFTAVFLLCLTSRAQFYNGSQLTFGKNRVQYSSFFWSYYRFEKFDTYFYLGGKELAVYTARIVDNYTKEIQKKFDYELSTRLQFIVFNKLSDLKQSNIGLQSDDKYNIGGTTYINGSKIMLYFDGNHLNFEKQIKAGITKIIINNMIFGDNIGSKMKNSTLLTLPEWYTEGLISFTSEEWSPQVEERIQSGFTSGKFKKINTLTGEDVMYAGHSIWSYINNKYGRQAITNLVYMTRVTRNVDNSFLYILGIPFKTFIKEWSAYYESVYISQTEKLENPKGTDLLVKMKNTRFYTQVHLSPDGKYVSYATIEMGQIKIWLKNVETGKIKKIYRYGHKLDEKVDYSNPIIAWHSSSQFFSYLLEKKGALILTDYHIEEKRKESLPFFQLDKILDLSYSKDGKKIVLSAVQNGSSDVFVYNRQSHTYERITNDPFDDLNPRFVNNDKEIVFSSNRTTDTIPHIYNLTDDAKLKRNFDLYSYSYSKKYPILTRLTNTEGVNETNPTEYQPGYIAYISDKNGIRNRYLLHVDSAFSHIDTIAHYRKIITSFPTTNYNTNIQEQEISTATGKVCEIFLQKGTQKLLVNDIQSAEKSKHNTLENSYFRDYLKRQKIIEDSIKQVAIKKKEATQKKKIVNVHADDKKGDPKKIDINNYSFDGKTGKKDSTKSLVIKKKEVNADSAKQFYIPLKRIYETSYQINQLVTQVDFNYLNTGYQSYTGGASPIFINSGAGAFIKLGVSDIFEDYRITGGCVVPTSLNSEYLLSFANLKRRLDEEWIFHRVTVDDVEGSSLIKHYTHEVRYIIKWPFSNILALKVSGIARHDRAVYKATDMVNLDAANTYQYWCGVKTELVFDNTINKGLNIYYGTRYVIFGEQYAEIDNFNKNLTVLGCDFRNYHKIYRTFIWANRFAASTSFGGDKLIYYMGGVDAWLSPKFNTDIPIDRTQNYVYQTLATNLRGFTQNIRNGNSFAVINSELRFPVFKVLRNRPMKSDFLENFQVIGFTDIGTAWTGPSPYSKKNALYTQVIQQDPLTITLQNIREPIVGGYGFGLRSRLFGYFIRADWAWGVEDLKVQPMVFYLSFCLDF